MKPTSTFFLVIALTAGVFIKQQTIAQAPEKMSYQAVIRNSSDQLVKNQAVGMKISLLQGTVTGTIIYQETYNPNPQTNANGLVSVEIGGGIPITGTFEGIDWSAGPYFLKTETDPAGGTNYTITGTSQILSVPYALYAKTAENGFSGDYNDLLNLPTLNIVNWNTAYSWGDHSGLYKPISYNPAWTEITGKPTTLTGYGITDAMSSSHAANGITSTNITNWNTAYGWGNHTGLYRPISYVPAWTEITSKPTTLSGYGITDAVNTTGAQTIGGNKTFTGKTTVITPVSATDAVNKEYVDQLISRIEALEASLDAGTFIDSRDNHYYEWKKIGNQIWMAENLTYLPSVSPSTSYSSTAPYYYVYDYEGNSVSSAIATANYSKYGVLYNWPAAMNGAESSITNPSGVQGVCPNGWHLPSDAEWKQLEIYLGMSQSDADLVGWRGTDQGTKMKSTSGWDGGGNGNNVSGFSALPAGDRNYGGYFSSVGSYGGWWVATVYNTENAMQRSLFNNKVNVGRDTHNKAVGISVRCVKD
jgi:uncharacterized protein (TIGR02145 family)